jgi:aminoglycoside phosphotransferase
VDLQKLMDRFGADGAEPIYGGLSEATVVRLARGREFFYYKQGEILGDEADRLEWLAATGFLCPRIVDRGNGWMLTTELRGRDATDDWPAADRPAVLSAMATGLRDLHALPRTPFGSPFPGTPEVVTHGDYAAPNVFIDPETLQFSGMLDVGKLGMGDKYVDLALMYKSLANGRNPQYGLVYAARSFVEQYGGDPDDSRIPYYIGLDDSDSFWERNTPAGPGGGDVAVNPARRRSAPCPG